MRRGIAGTAAAGWRQARPGQPADARRRHRCNDESRSGRPIRALVLRFRSTARRHSVRARQRVERYRSRHRPLTHGAMTAGSDPLEVLFDLAPRDSQHHRPTMRAHGRVRRRAQFLEDVRHLLVGRAGSSPSLPRGTPWWRRCAAAHPERGRPGRAPRGRRPAQQRLRAVLGAEQGRHRGHLDGPFAEGLDLVPEPGEIGRTFGQRLLGRRRARPSAAARADAATRGRPASSCCITRSNSTRSCATC